MSGLYNEEEEKKFIYAKKITCPNCKGTFEDLRVLNSKLRRLEPDLDLRPRFQNIDSLKYGVSACPNCGYAALSKNFERLSSLQQKRLREKITSQFMPREASSAAVLDYTAAIEQYELAFVCALAMDLPLSEQAYLCLQISWLLRGRLEEVQAQPEGYTDELIGQLKEKEEHYYKKAYDGLTKAAMQEDFPICGMDQPTFDYLLAVLSMHFKAYDQALKYCGGVVQTRGINARLKDKALMLKDDITAAKKAEEEATA